MFVSKKEYIDLSNKFDYLFSNLKPEFGNDTYLSLIYDINKLKKEEKNLSLSKSEKKENEIRANLYFKKSKLIIKMENYDISRKGK